MSFLWPGDLPCTTVLVTWKRLYGCWLCDPCPLSAAGTACSAYAELVIQMTSYVESMASSSL